MPLNNVYRRWKAFDDAMSDSQGLKYVKEWVDALMPFALAALGFALYAEFFMELTREQYLYVIRTEQALLGYFVFEVVVDLLIYRDNKQFFKDNWVDIVLIIPFLSVVRGGAKFLRVFKFFKPLKGVKPLKTGKTAKVVKVGKGWKGVKVVQKLGKIAKKGRKFASKLFR